MSEDTYKMLTAFSGMGNFMRGKLEGLTFSGMQDTPTGYESGKYLVSTTSGVEWTDAPASGDSSTFAALTDTPTGYESGKYLVSTASGVEWTNAPVGGSSSAGGGAFANSESGIYWSNFYTGVPDAIMLPDSNGNENILNLNQLLLSDEIYYEARYYTNEFKGISFRNDDIGEVGTYQAGIGGAVTSLSGILDEGRALYYGGSSSSGGAEEGYLLDQFLGWINSGTSESVVLDGKSEYLVTILNRGSDSTYLHVPFWHSFNIDSSDGTISLISDPGGNKVSTSYDNETDTLTIGANSSQIYEVKVFKKTQAGGGSSTFAALTDTPTELTADKYLKVNTEGTALELVDAPVSSGGVGSSAEIESRSNFNSTIPDQMIVKHNDGSASIYQLRYVSTTLISYHDTISTHSADQRRIMFNNNPSGTMNSIEGSGTNPGDQPFEGATATLQDIIDGGHAIYIGGSSGSSSENGIGNLPYIKNKTNFNGRLPDAILAIGPDPNNWDKLMHLDEYLKDEGIFYKSNDAGFMFNDDPTGTMKSHSGTHTLPNGTNTTIQDMIDAGRAMYYG